MATAAALLKHRGHEVQGSDQNVYPPMSDFLRAEAIPILSPFAAKHVASDLGLVVVGNAISRGNPELEAVLERKIRYCSLPEVIRDHFLWSARSIVLAGTPLYMAPEVVLGGPPSVQSDVYSLGVLIYYLLTGTYPVYAPDFEELRMLHSRSLCKASPRGSLRLMRDSLTMRRNVSHI